MKTIHSQIILISKLYNILWILIIIIVAYNFCSFAGDTCTALENFQSDPINSSLSSILPCDELVSAESVLLDVSQGVHQMVNEVRSLLKKSLFFVTLVTISTIWKLQVNQKLSIEYGNVAQICNPFSGPPQYNYEPGNCSSTTIRVGDLPRVISSLISRMVIMNVVQLL